MRPHAAVPKRDGALRGLRGAREPQATLAHHNGGFLESENARPRTPPKESAR